MLPVRSVYKVQAIFKTSSTISDHIFEQEISLLPNNVTND
jgi:hypothetical protein